MVGRMKDVAGRNTLQIGETSNEQAATRKMIMVPCTLLMAEGGKSARMVLARLEDGRREK